MRLDGRTGRYPDWTVWHAEQCCRLWNVVWVDDETAQYAQYNNSPWAGVLNSMTVHQAKRIEIHFGSKLVIINPLVDHEEQDVDQVEGTGKPAMEPTT